MKLSKRVERFAAPFNFEGSYVFTPDELLGFVKMFLTIERVEETGAKKIDRAIADEIREKVFGQRMSQADVARLYGVSQSLVSMIINNKVHT